MLGFKRVLRRPIETAANSGRQPPYKLGQVGGTPRPVCDIILRRLRQLHPPDQATVRIPAMVLTEEGCC